MSGKTRGSAIVEASLVIPLVLLALVLLIGVIAALYDKTTLRYQEHRREMVREAEPEDMGTALRLADFVKGWIE